MHFYVCSSGGCGSTMLSAYLSRFGKVSHIHSREPPARLTYVGKENTDEEVYSEWFNHVEIPETDLDQYRVIFIYRNPLEVIFSRCVLPHGPNTPHLQHIQCNFDGRIGLGDLLQTGRDLYGLEEFYNNYTSMKPRNYAIYAVKYEWLFHNWSLFNRTLGIPDIPAWYPVKRERKKRMLFTQELGTIYRNLIAKMESMPFIRIYPATR